MALTIRQRRPDVLKSAKIIKERREEEGKKYVYIYFPPAFKYTEILRPRGGKGTVSVTSVAIYQSEGSHEDFSHWY